MADVQSSWNKDKMVNYLVLRMTPLEIPLSRSVCSSICFFLLFIVYWFVDTFFFFFFFEGYPNFLAYSFWIRSMGIQAWKME